MNALFNEFSHTLGQIGKYIVDLGGLHEVYEQARLNVSVKPILPARVAFNDVTGANTN
jgi:hypothetical protein